MKKRKPTLHKHIEKSIFEDCTEKQKEIVQFVYRFRFLNRVQLQQLLYHKNHKRILTWLNDLVTKQYLGRKYDKHAGRNKIPTIYFLSKKGKAYIASRGIKTHYSEKLMREENVSFVTQNHCLMTAEVFLLLRGYVEKKQKDFTFQTKADIAQEYPNLQIKPDGIFFYEDEMICFLEIDRETESRATMRKKLERYINYYFSKKWHIFSKEYFPCIISISLSKKRVHDLMLETEQLLQLYNHPPIIMKFTTYEESISNGIAENICRVPFKKKFYTLM